MPAHPLQHETLSQGENIVNLVYLESSPFLLLHSVKKSFLHALMTSGCSRPLWYTPFFNFLTRITQFLYPINCCAFTDSAFFLR